MGIFDFGKKAAKISSLESQLQSLTQLINNKLATITQYPVYTTHENSERYCTTDDVYSIVSLIASSVAMMEFYNYIKDSNGELTEAPEDHPLSLLVETPVNGLNEYEGYFNIAASYLIHGEFILYKERPDLGPNSGKVTKLHLFHPECVNIKVSTNYPFTIVAYQYTVNGQIIFDDIPVEDIIHAKNMNPKLGVYGSELRGLSNLRVLAKRLTRIDSNTDVATAQLQNGGVPGIVFEKGEANDITDVIGTRKKNFYNYLNNSSNKGAPYFAAGELQYIALGLKLADLEVAELAKIDFKKLCNVYHVSDRLFNNDATGSEISDKSARVGLFTNAAIPLAKVIAGALTKGLAYEFKDKKYCIEYDSSEIPELQMDYGSMVTWLSQAWWLTPNERREMMKFEEVDEPLFNEYLIPSGLQTIEDLKMVDPLENTGDYGQTNDL